MLICYSVHWAAYGNNSFDAVVRRFCPFPYWGKGVIVDFDPAGVWACACAYVDLSYMGAASARGKTPPVKGVSNIIIRNGSASARPHHRVHKRLFVSHVFLNMFRRLTIKKVDRISARI